DSNGDGIGALKGIILDADASTLYNLYTEFDITAKTVDFALDVTTTDVAAKCREVVRHIEDNLKGEIKKGVRCLVSGEFFDAFIAHANVEKFYVNWQNAAQIAQVDPRSGFNFSGITFEEYRGTATDENDVARRFIAANEGHAFPEGTSNTFKTIYAPGEFIEAANTPGLEMYAKQAMEPMGRWVDIHMESNPLPICCRPAVLVKVTI
ncbi:MAG: major capsid protein, partial [Deltaproteobacteria bacterium]|nr:major capsid protein [Deltaproteobacteria bacterium]